MKKDDAFEKWIKDLDKRLTAIENRAEKVIKEFDIELNLCLNSLNRRYN